MSCQSGNKKELYVNRTSPPYVHCSIESVVMGKSGWIAATQRLWPNQVQLVQSEGTADEYCVLVPKRQAIWYLVFAALVWGIASVIVAVFWVVADDRLVQLAIGVLASTVAFVLSLERKIVITKSRRLISISHRFAFLPICFFEQTIVFAFQMTVEAVKTRDAEGRKQVEIIVLDGRRKLEVLLTFACGWASFSVAQEIALRLNDLLSLSANSNVGEGRTG